MSNRILLQIAALSFGPALGLGVARFAYALLLPSMQNEMGWTYSQAGWLNTANAIGYMAGAVLAFRFERAIGLRASFLLGVWGCVVTTFGMAFAGSLEAMTALRAVAGVSGALVFVCGGVAAARCASNHEAQAGLIVALYYGGPGIGILLSGIAVPYALEYFGDAVWRETWAYMGAASVLLALVAGAGRPALIEAPRTARVDRTFAIRSHLWILVGYFIFGAGYIGYMTFMYAHIQELGAGIVLLSGFWSAIGVATILSPFLWSGIIGRKRNGSAFALLVGLTCIGSLLPLLARGEVVVLGSALCFGSAFFAVVAATTAYVRRNSPSTAFPYAIGIFSTCFALGQVAGPIAAGYLSDISHGLYAGMLGSVAALMIAAILGALQRDHRAAPGRAAD